MIYAGLKSLIKKVDGYKNNPKKLSKTKTAKRIPFWYSVSPIQAFDGIENKHNVKRGENCIKKFRQFLQLTL